VSSASDFSPVIVNQECIITEVLNSLLSAASPSPVAAAPSDFGGSGPLKARSGSPLFVVLTEFCETVPSVCGYKTACRIMLCGLLSLNSLIEEPRFGRPAARRTGLRDGASLRSSPRIIFSHPVPFEQNRCCATIESAWCLRNRIGMSAQLASLARSRTLPNAHTSSHEHFSHVSK